MSPDLDLLQGSWMVTALEAEGQRMPAEMLEHARIAVKGKRFKSTGMGAVYEGTLELDASASPRRLDMKFDAGPEKGNTNFCIYELDGDSWKICIATRGDTRPSSFASPPGSGLACETLVREAVAAQAKPRVSRKAGAQSTRGGAAGPAQAAATAPATELEGDWRMVSGVMNGQAMDQSVVHWVNRVTRGNRTTVYAGPQVMMQFEFTIDPAQFPKIIDYRNTSGPNKGKTQLGIYELEGGLLKILVSAPGAARPTAIQPEPTGTLTVWKRS